MSEVLSSPTEVHQNLSTSADAQEQRGSRRHRKQADKNNTRRGGLGVQNTSSPRSSRSSRSRESLVSSPTNSEKRRKTEANAAIEEEKKEAPADSRQLQDQQSENLGGDLSVDSTSELTGVRQALLDGATTPSGSQPPTVSGSLSPQQ